MEQLAEQPIEQQPVEQQPAARSERLWSRPFVALLIVNFLVFFGFHMMTPTLPLYAKTLGAPDAHLGWVIASTTLVAIVFRPFVGAALDRFGRKWLLLSGIFLMGLLTLAISFFPLFAMLLVLRTIMGAAWAVTNTSSSTVAADIIPRGRFGEGIGFYGFSASFAMALAPALSLYIFDAQGVGMALIIGFGAFMASLLLALTLRYRPGSRRRGKDAGGVGSGVGDAGGVGSAGDTGGVDGVEGIGDVEDVRERTRTPNAPSVAQPAAVRPASAPAGAVAAQPVTSAPADAPASAPVASAPAGAVAVQPAVGSAQHTATQPAQPTAPHGIATFIEAKALLPALMAFFLMGSFGAIQAFAAILATARHIDGAPLFFFAFAGLMLIARPLFGKLADRRGYRLPMLVGLAFALIGLVVLSFAQDLTVLLLAGTALGMGFGAASPTTQAMAVADVPPTRRGTATATYFVGFDGGLGLGAVGGGLLAQALGYGAMFQIIAVLPLVTLFIYLLTAKRYASASSR